MDNLPDTSRFGLSQEFVGQALETLEKFESKIDDIRRQPATLSVVNESEEFKCDLHYVVGLLLLGEDELSLERRYLKNHELFRKRFFCVIGEDEIRTLSEKSRFYESHMDRMRKVLNQAREMKLGPCIDTAKQARTLDIRIKKILGHGHVDFRPAVLFESVVRAINDLRERNSLCPAWADHEAKFTLHQSIIGQTRGERYILTWLVYLFSYFLPQHASQVTTKLNFHCRYFDDEIRNLAVCVREQCVNQFDLLEANLISESNFCDIWLDNIDNFTPCDLLPRRFGLRMYRVCLITGSCRLADKWMNLRFDENLDEKDVVDALHGTINSIREMKQLSITRIKLNGEQEGVVAQTQYKLPERKEELEEPTCQKPWWVEVFGNRIKGIFPPVSIPASTGESCSTTADTVVLSTEKYDSMIRKDRSSDFQKKLAEKSNTSVSSSDNQHAAWIFTHNDRMRDRDIYSINFSLPDGVVQDAITLEWTNRQGEKQSRKTNIKRNTPYHCRVLSYDVLQDEWVITSDFCRVTGPLTVEKKGASCDPLLGNCGFYEEKDCFVFKVHRDPHDHRLRNYLSGIRSQCTASFYVDKFSRLIGHRFERLRMLTVDCLLLFADSDRETIIDIMTREKRVDIMEKRKSALKFDKFTNNTSWKNRGIDTAVLEAFAHYTYQESDGVLMVADLQGWVWNTHEYVVLYTLTDPVIHCPKRPVRFGETNREEKGILLFFTKIHLECNEICRELHLKRPAEFENA